MEVPELELVQAHCSSPGSWLDQSIWADWSVDTATSVCLSPGGNKLPHTVNFSPVGRSVSVSSANISQDTRDFRSIYMVPFFCRETTRGPFSVHKSIFYLYLLIFFAIANPILKMSCIKTDWRFLCICRCQYARRKSKKISNRQLAAKSCRWFLWK